MIWLTWRQFRAAAAMAGGALALLAAILGATGQGMADDYAAGLSACGSRAEACNTFMDRFFDEHTGPFLALLGVMLLVPALVGLFWGAPLITRELEAGTHRLVWNQSVTRGRWLAVKLAVLGLAAAAAAGLASLMVGWWASPIDKSGADSFPRMGRILFDVRGVVPIGYALFAFALGVTVGLLVRRTLPAMAVTLAVFAAVQVAMPLLVRPHLLPPTRDTMPITMEIIDQLRLEQFGPDGRPAGPIVVKVKAPAGGWLLSDHTVDPKGRRVSSIPLSPTSGPCGTGAMENCLAEMTRLGYRQRLTYLPTSRFWPLQWAETALYALLTLGLAAFCFRRIRNVS